MVPSKAKSFEHHRLFIKSKIYLLQLINIAILLLMSIFISKYPKSKDPSWSHYFSDCTYLLPGNGYIGTVEDQNLASSVCSLGMVT